MDHTPLDQLPDRFGPPRPSPLGKAVMINLAVMIFYLSLTSLLSGTGNYVALGVLTADIILVLLQAGINFVLGLILLFTDLRHTGSALLISSLIVGIGGFALSIGKIVIAEGI